MGVGLGVGLGVASAAAAHAAPVDDAARAKARALGYAGVEAYAEGKYEVARDKFEESFQLLPVPSLGLWSARALVKLGKLVEAEERYRAVANLVVGPDDPAVQHTAQQDASKEHAQLLARLPSVRIRIAGASAEEVAVSVDGTTRSEAELSRALVMNPGRHEVSGTRGDERSQVVLMLGEGAHEEVDLRFSGRPLLPVVVAPPSPPPVVVDDADPNAAWRTGGWLTLGAGAVGITTGLVAYLVAQDQYSGFERRALCQYEDGELVNGGCTSEEVDTYDTLRTLHLVGLIGGGVLAAAGATILVLTWEREPAVGAPALSLRLGPGSAAVAGTF